MDNWILGVWFLGAFAIGGTAYMLGGYATAPKAAIILWAVFAVWMVTGPTIWFHQNYTIVRRSLLSAANGEVPQPIPTQIRWQFLGGQQAPTVLYEQNIATWYTMWTPSIVVSGLDVHGKLTNQVSTGPYWTIFLTFKQAVTYKQITLFSPNISSYEVKQTSTRAAIIIVNQDIPAGPVEVATIP